jgi:hypothetical protein
MKQELNLINRPLLRTRGLSTHHLDIFEYIMMGKSNREINCILGYSKKSHAVVDHSRKVMYKLLALEGLPKKTHNGQVIFPRDYCFWWKNLYTKHKLHLEAIAIKPEYYIEREENE